MGCLYPPVLWNQLFNYWPLQQIKEYQIMKRLGTAIVVGILFGLASLRVNADLCNNIPRNLTPKTVNQINHCVATAHSTQGKYLASAPSFL